jgi:Fur family ferric uptake transcriptional regulator
MRDPGDEGSTAELRTDGVRVTRQRVAILQVLREASDHPGAEDILMRARAIDPTVSLATVYRTLSVLEKAGTVLRNEFGGAGARYELASAAHHDHLIDLDTGAVVEFRSDQIERLQAEIAAELGYDIEWHRFEIYGRRRPQGSG